MPLRVQLKALGGLFKGRGPKEVVQPAVGNPDEMGFSAFYAAVLANVCFLPQSGVHQGMQSWQLSCT